jgi:hypothetical protein
MAKPNYRQVKRQKEMARKNRQQEKQGRRATPSVQTSAGAAEAPADDGVGAIVGTDSANARS